MTEPRRTTMTVEEETEGDLGTKRMIVNFGPQHPATHGTLRNIIELDGERVMKLECEIGYLHSGFEKISEYRTYNQTVTVTDRMNYLSPLCNNVGFALAVEEMMGIKATPRCAAIRVALCELSRIADHILSVGLQAMDLGAFTVMLWTFIEREKLYDIFENVTGARLTTSYTRVGGLLRDVPPDFEEMCRKFMKNCAKTIDDIEAVLNGNRIFIDRTVGVSPVPRDVAISFGLTGPLLRAAGVPYDVRKARPYLGYENYQFDVITEENGDAWCRYRLRVREMRESLKILDQVLKAIPEGPIYVDDPRIVIPPKTAMNTPGGGMEGLIYHFKNYMMGHGMCPPKGEVYSCTEAPNGELGFYLVSDGTQRPYRWRVRPPSLYNYQAFPYMTEGGLLSDVVAVMSSLNIIAGELDLVSREFNDATKQELERICSRYPKREAALLPALRLLEREFGCVDSDGMVHVAKLLGISPAKVFGVFTFYTHYKRPSDRKYVIEHCSTVPCALRGSEKIHDHLRSLIQKDDPITLKKVECLASCDTAPCLQVNGDYVDHVTPEMCDAMIAQMRSGSWKAPTPKYQLPKTKYPPILLKHVLEPGSETLDHYRKRGGYETWLKIHETQRNADEIVEEVFKAGLRGRGGAGFPTGQKWKFLAKNDKPRYLVVNADESEPGTFKDKMLIDRDPHALLEGILISGYAIKAKCAYIYIRGEFVTGAKTLEKAVAEAEAAGLFKGFPITVHRGAGAYICGEETGLLSSLEGNRGYPKIKPPFPAVEGLFRCPTIVNNVETLMTVTHIIKNGSEWFRKMGTEKSPGMKIFSVCGHVERPGNYEIPLSVPLKEVIYDLAGGIKGGKKLKAVIPGGLSAPMLTAAEVLADPPLKMDFDALAAAKTMLGSGGIIVIDDETCIVDTLWNTLRFYHHESCGQCTPCREGTGWIEKLAAKAEQGRGRVDEVGKIDEVAWGMVGRTICVLADAAAMPARSMVTKFKAEFEAHSNAKGCPFKHGNVPELTHA